MMELVEPTAAQFAFLSAARGNRLRRCYYRTSYVDAVVAGAMGGGTGKVDTLKLREMVDCGWLIEPPEESPEFDYLWKLTEAGAAARQRYLTRPRGWRGVKMWRRWFVSAEVKRDVARGAALLDAKRPGWRHLVDVGRLDMWDYRNCVLGQVFGGYGEGLRLLSLDLVGDVPWEHGFVPYGHSQAGLRRRWKRVVRRGRKY